MKTYCYSVWDYLGNDRFAEITEAEILDRYWNYWHGRMVEKFGKDHPLITKEKCIEDWCIGNWAWEKQ